MATLTIKIDVDTNECFDVMAAAGDWLVIKSSLTPEGFRNKEKYIARAATRKEAEAIALYLNGQRLIALGEYVELNRKVDPASVKLRGSILPS